MEKIEKEKIKELKKIRAAGINPYPEISKRDFPIKTFREKFSSFLKSKKEVFVVGRIRAKRMHGKISFLDLEDQSGKIQLCFKEDALGPSSYEFFKKYLEVGDFLQVKGAAFKTKTGEKSLLVSDYKILAKALLPLPEKWHGLKDVEERFRKRYLDLIFNPEVKERFVLRSKIISEIRKFLEKEGFLEVETPILQTVYGGGRAKPFKTYLEAMDLPLYLRIAPELYLKRLLVGGFEKVFEIGKCFRNEGIDRFHNPDFTTLEFYWAYATYKDLMRLSERMLASLVQKIFKKKKIEYQGQKISFKVPFQRIEFSHLFSKELKANYDDINEKFLAKKAKSLGLEISPHLPKFEIADQIFKKLIRPKIIQPTFVLHYPLGFQVLAKAKEDNPKRLANFQLIVAGIELANAFSELNDPLEQQRRFEEQQKLFKEGYSEAHPYDKDFLEALKYGMPPAAGFGLGIDRLVMLLTEAYSLREVILFPTLKPK